MKKSRGVLFGLALLLGGSLCLIAVPSAFARIVVYPPPHYRPYPPMSVSLEVVADGRTMSTVQHGGRTYLPVSRWGQEYTLRITNHGSRRIAAVVSVDGLSVISGKPASEGDAGYVVDAYSSLDIKGWRRNLDRVAAFSFEERHNSYASRTGRPENVGVIGLVAFEEQVYDYRPVPKLADGYKSSPARPESSYDSARAYPPPPGIGGTGTGYGRDIDSAVQYINFVRSSNKRNVTIYYDTRAALRRAGIIEDDVRPIPVYPHPFPTDGDFAPPAVRWEKISITPQAAG